MEVHAHSHTADPDSHRGKKKWTHYLWEFLMLFLAVFCGFLAENQREHMVEHSRAKAYAKSLLQDLQNDTEDISKAASFEMLTVSMIDSLVDFVSDKSPAKKSGQLYYYMRLAGHIYTVDWSKATLNQLINSGNLRYFTNSELVTKISAYSTHTNIITTMQEWIDKNRDRATTYRDHIFNAQWAQVFAIYGMNDLYNGIKSPFIDSLRNLDVPLQNKDTDLLNSYANALLATKPNRQALVMNRFPKAIKEAIEIMELIKKEYHLK